MTMMRTIELEPQFRGRWSPRTLPEVSICGRTIDRDETGDAPELGVYVDNSFVEIVGDPDTVAAWFERLAATIRARADHFEEGETVFRYEYEETS